MKIPVSFRAVTAMVSAAATLALASAPTAEAARLPDPTPSARAHGIERSGEAYMGWQQDRQTSTTLTRQTHAKTAASTANRVSGIDVSGHQGNVNWSYWWGQGKRFAYVKATEGDYFTNRYFAQQYNGSYRVGMIRGAYHFATPGDSSGRTQADYFLAHGGGWSKDGKTLPGVLDIEYNPYGPRCYGLSQSAMVSWIKAFSDRYRARTSRDVVIYTNADWWKSCTGNTTAFNRTNPLWVARYSSSPGVLPGNWPYWTFWQYNADKTDKDYFNGSMTRLRALANG